VRLYEHEVKELFARHGIPVPSGTVVRSPDDLGTLEPPVACKAQILAGGRGKAGGIRFASTVEEARGHVRDLLGSEIRGYPVSAVLLERKLGIQEEWYLGITLNRAGYCYTVLVSPRGGMDIEETARSSPEAVTRRDLQVDAEFHSHHAVGLLKEAGVSGRALRSMGNILTALVAMFRRYDAKLLEINPLARTDEGFVAADGRMSVDDDALFRQPHLRELGVRDRHELGELTEREKKAASEGIPYLDLDGDIGMFPGGAGFGIMGNDFIHHFGGRPANFMDSGGGPTPERLAKMLTLLEENPRVKAIFGARFGGISRCDDFAKGLLIFLEREGLTKPMALRMTGNMWEEGLRILQEAREKNPALFENISFHGIETPIEDVAREAVEMARSAGG
jgi:succinyl-CoA synthetase beta subunit